MKADYIDKYRQIGLKIAYYRKPPGLYARGTCGEGKPDVGVHRACRGSEYQQGGFLGHTF